MIINKVSLQDHISFKGTAEGTKKPKFIKPNPLEIKPASTPPYVPFHRGLQADEFNKSNQTSFKANNGKTSYRKRILQLFK